MGWVLKIINKEANPTTQDLHTTTPQGLCHTAAPHLLPSVLQCSGWALGWDSGAESRCQLNPKCHQLTHGDEQTHLPH